MANAYFIRANCYYWIARIWGDAPLVLEGYESASQDLRPTRTPAGDIYLQVESDIEEALSRIPQGIQGNKTATAGAINMLKADFSLWMYGAQNGGDGYLDKAEAAVDAVLSAGRYSLNRTIRGFSIRKPSRGLRLFLLGIINKTNTPAGIRTTINLTPPRCRLNITTIPSWWERVSNGRSIPIAMWNTSPKTRRIAESKPTIRLFSMRDEPAFRLDKQIRALWVNGYIGAGFRCHFISPCRGIPFRCGRLKLYRNDLSGAVAS